MSIFDAGTVVVKRFSDDIHSRTGFNFHTDEIDVPAHFEDDTELLDFMVICCLSPSRYFN